MSAGPRWHYRPLRGLTWQQVAGLHHVKRGMGDDVPEKTMYSLRFNGFVDHRDGAYCLTALGETLWNLIEEIGAVEKAEWLK